MASPVTTSRMALLPPLAIVFVNNQAGAGRVRHYLPRIKTLFEASGCSAEFVMTQSSKDLESRTCTAIGNGARLLLSMGGDGTFQGLANAAYGTDVILGVLPTGGGNDFAAALGLPKDPIAAAHALLRGQPRWVDLARAKTADGRTCLYVGGGGVGLDAEAIRYTSGMFRRMPGRLRYIAAALQTLRSFKPLPIRVEFPGSDQAPIQADVLLAGVMNTPSYGAGLRLAPEARLNDGILEFVCLEDLSLRDVISLLPRLTWNGELRTSRLLRRRARCIRLTTERPCNFHGDGEILGPAPVEIEVVPRAVQVLAPEIVGEPAS